MRFPLFLLLAFGLTSHHSQAQTALPAPTAAPMLTPTPTPTTAPTTTPKPRFAPVRRIVSVGVPSFTSKQFGFAARFPSRPVQTTLPMTAVTGEKLTIFTFLAQNDGIAYVIQATPPPPTIDSTSPQRQLDSVQQGLLGSSDARLQKREAIQLGDVPGRDFKLAASSGTRTLRLRAYFTPQAFYSVFAAGLKGPMTTHSAQVEAFLNSLRISPRPAALPPPLFRSTKFKFSIQLPVKPVEREKTTPLPGGGSSISIHSFSTQTEAVNYLINVT